MQRESVSEIVEAKRSELLEACDGLQEAVARAHLGVDRVARGLLVLGETEEAINWFDPLVEKWTSCGEDIWETKFEQKETDVVPMSPWHEFQMGLFAGFLGQSDVSEAAQTALDRTTKPFVDELTGRREENRIDAVRILAAYLLDEDWRPYAEQLQASLEEGGNQYRRARYPPYVTVIEGIVDDDAEAVESGVQNSITFHEEFIVGARDADAVDEALAHDASALLALARKEGVNAEVDSEYVPDALTGEEYYPVGGAN